MLDISYLPNRIFFLRYTADYRYSTTVTQPYLSTAKSLAPCSATDVRMFGCSEILISRCPPDSPPTPPSGSSLMAIIQIHSPADVCHHNKATTQPQQSNYNSNINVCNHLTYNKGCESTSLQSYTCYFRSTNWRRKDTGRIFYWLHITVSHQENVSGILACSGCCIFLEEEMVRSLFFPFYQYYL